MVWHETGTGMRNPIRALCELAHRMGRRTFVDCVSALGVEDIHVLRDHIDVCTSVGNKGVGATTGVAMVVARRAAVPPLSPVLPRRTMYLNLQNHLAWADERGQTPNTPAVTMIVALDHGLQELLTEGLEHRVARTLECSRVIRIRARAMGLRLLLPEALFCNPITTMLLPPGVHVDDFIDALDARGYVVYPGKGPLHEQNAFQVATMGALTVEDCHRLMDVMDETLEELRRAAA